MNTPFKNGINFKKPLHLPDPSSVRSQSFSPYWLVLVLIWLLVHLFTCLSMIAFTGLVLWSYLGLMIWRSKVKKRWERQDRKERRLEDNNLNLNTWLFPELLETPEKRKKPKRHLAQVCKWIPASTWLHHIFNSYNPLF